MTYQTTAPRVPTDIDGSARTLGVLLLRQDDSAAPFGCSGLREQDGTPLVLHALRLLAGHVRATVVLTPAAVESEVRKVLVRAGDTSGGQVLVVTEESASSWWDLVGSPDVMAAVVAEEKLIWVIVHEPVFASVPPGLLTELSTRAEAGDHDAVIPVRPVTDTLKRVDGTGRIVATVDRDSLRALCTPQLYRACVLPGSVTLPWTSTDVAAPGTGSGIGAGTQALVTEVRVTTGRVTLIEVPAGLTPVDPTLD